MEVLLYCILAALKHKYKILRALQLLITLSIRQDPVRVIVQRSLGNLQIVVFDLDIVQEYTYQ